jgi:tetrahydromethanopterin S-methyltransferase subunit G
MANEDLKEIIINSEYYKKRYKQGRKDGVFFGLMFSIAAIVCSVLILLFTRIG